MHSKFGRFEQQFKETKSKSTTVEAKKECLLDEPRDTKEANSKMSKAMGVDAFSAHQQLDQVHQWSTVAVEGKDDDAATVEIVEDVWNETRPNARRVQRLYAEVESLKESLANSTNQLEISHIDVQAQRMELGKAKYLRAALEEKEATLKKLKENLINAERSESHALDELSEANMRLHVTEYEMEKAKESESKMFSFLALQTKQLEQTKILLEECRLEITCLNEKVEYLERSGEQNSIKNAPSYNCYSHFKGMTVGAFKPEHQVVQECPDRSKGEALSQSKVEAFARELKLLRTKLKLATDAEKKNRKAMDDMAIVLREVLTETNETKAKLISIQLERENAMREVESEARKEAQRLRLEVEESNLIWNRKELALLNCIKGLEEEFDDIKEENSRLSESLREEKEIAKMSKEEANKLRDIIKQAVNDANAAKKAAEIARTENCQLKDILAEKDVTLQDLTFENESLRINEASALENIKSLRRLFSTATSPRTPSQSPSEAFSQQILTRKENEDDKTLVETVNKLTGHKEGNEEPKKEKTLKTSSVLTYDAMTLNSQDFDHLDENQVNNIDEDRNKESKKRALLRRFGNLLKTNLP